MDEGLLSSISVGVVYLDQIVHTYLLSSHLYAKGDEAFGRLMSFIEMRITLELHHIF